MAQLTKSGRRLRIRRRVRKVVSGTATRPRLAVFRSNKEIYAQLVDDVAGNTLAFSTSLKGKLTGNKMETAAIIGKQIAEKAQSAGISEVVFDRGGYLYHGRVKSLAEAAREAGLKF
jgi:large subunit ribosomal protein L18